MKRNAFLITAVLFGLASLATAAEEKKEAAPKSRQAEQTETARNDADAHMDRDASAKSDCATKQGKESKSRDMQDDSEGDPQASQNQVEYGGGG